MARRTVEEKRETVLGRNGTVRTFRVLGRRGEDRWVYNDDSMLFARNGKR